MALLDGSIMSSTTLSAFLSILPFLVFQQSPHGHRLPAVAEALHPHVIAKRGAREWWEWGDSKDHFLLLCISYQEDKPSWKQFH